MPGSSHLIPALLLLLLQLAGQALPAVVLPRPPSSPNYIPQEYGGAADLGSKSYSEKALYQSQTNVEKPDTQDYRYVYDSVCGHGNGGCAGARCYVKRVMAGCAARLSTDVPRERDNKYSDRTFRRIAVRSGRVLGSPRRV